MRSLRLILPVSLVSLLATPIASAAIVPGQVVVRVGDTPIGAPAPVTDLRSPFAESSGAVGFSGEVMGGQDFVFREDQVIFLNSDEMTVTLGDHEVAMGTGEGGLFIISPSISGDDGLYASGVVLGRDETAAPGLPGFDATFFQRPAMVDDGVAYWIMGIAPTGQTITQNRVLMTSPDGTAASAVPVLQGGQVVGAFTIDDAVGQEGVQDEFQASYDANHLIAIVDLTFPAQAIYVDGAIVARQLLPSGDGATNWETFDLVAINNAGNYAFTGDVDGATTADEILAYNGAIVAREGGTLAGVDLPSGATLRMVSLDDNGNMAYVWGGGGMTETAFYSCGLGLSPMNTLNLVADNDELDIDGDGSGDGFIITDLLASSVGAQRALANDGSIYIAALVSTDDGLTSSEAIIEMAAPSCCGNTQVQDGEECDDGNLTTTDACIACVAAECGDGFVQDGVEECDDAGESADCDDDCTAVSCGDGNTNEAAGEACDETMETATCDADCTAVQCGDGTVNGSAGEVCDDSGESDDCDDDCTAVSCGDGNANEAAGEACDDAGESATCDEDCTAATCGDNDVNNLAGETCDEGMRSTTCDGNCTAVSCGDGDVNMSAGEMCDGGGAETETCDIDCTTAVCGDNEVNATAGEECEDGNKDNTDDCVEGCVDASCGDGFEQAGVEECDDGNVDDGDGCSSTCTEEVEETSSSSSSNGSESGETGDSSSGDSSDTDTETDPMTSTSLSGSASATSPTTTSNTNTTATTADTEGDTDTDTDTGGATPSDGCSCTTDTSGRSLPTALLGLLFLGALRRRRRA